MPALYGIKSRLLKKRERIRTSCTFIWLMPVDQLLIVCNNNKADKRLLSRDSTAYCRLTVESPNIKLHFSLATTGVRYYGNGAHHWNLKMGCRRWKAIVWSGKASSKHHMEIKLSKCWNISVIKGQVTDQKFNLDGTPVPTVLEEPVNGLDTGQCEQLRMEIITYISCINKTLLLGKLKL